MRNTIKHPIGVAEALLETAQNDLIDCKRLYFHQSYPNAIRSLQTSIELMFKAFYCVAFLETNYDKLGHDICNIIPTSQKSINKMYSGDLKHGREEVLNRVKAHLYEKGIDPELKDTQHLLSLDYEKMVEVFYQYVWKDKPKGERTEDLIKLFSTDKSHEEVKDLINKLKDSMSDIQRIDKTRPYHIPDEDICSFCNYTHIGLPNHTRRINTNSLSSKVIIADFKRGYLRTLGGKRYFCNYYYSLHSIDPLTNLLLILSFLVQEHKIPATYVDSENYTEKIPSKIYSRKHPLVRNMRSICKYTCKTQKYLKKFFEARKDMNEAEKPLRKKQKQKRREY